MIGAILALATAATSPTFEPARPIKQAEWITAADYPSDAIWRQLQGDSEFRATFSDKGDIIDCEVTLTSGVAALDARVCPFLRLRAHVRPARDVDGTPVAAVYRDRVRWLLPNSKQPQRMLRNDVLLWVQKLPAGLDSPTSVRIALLVDKFGAIAGCQPLFPNEPSVLDKAACQQARLLLKPTAARTAAGDAVRSVQNAYIVFAVKPQDPPAAR